MTLWSSWSRWTWQAGGRGGGGQCVQHGGCLLPLLQQVRPNPFIWTRCEDGKILSRLWIKVEPWSWAGDCQVGTCLSRNSEGRDLLRRRPVRSIVDCQGNLCSLCKDNIDMNTLYLHDPNVCISWTMTFWYLSLCVCIFSWFCKVITEITPYVFFKYPK